jgi:hypothetical protein
MVNAPTKAIASTHWHSMEETFSLPSSQAKKKNVAIMDHP